jgi:cysteine-rich repeat protein
VKPPRCGDGILQGTNEECDDGTNDGAYGGCASNCKLAPRCGDFRVQRSDGEQCDDGPRGSSACTSTCRSTTPR